MSSPSLYHISELSDEERKFLFNRQSFADYATEAEDFSHLNCAYMLDVARQRQGATEPTSDIPDIVRSDPPKIHWMLSSGQCRFLNVRGVFIMSTEDFGTLLGGDNAKRACRYCTADFLYR